MWLLLVHFMKEKHTCIPIYYYFLIKQAASRENKSSELVYFRSIYTIFARRNRNEKLFAGSVLMKSFINL